MTTPLRIEFPGAIVVRFLAMNREVRLLALAARAGVPGELARSSPGLSAAAAIGRLAREVEDVSCERRMDLVGTDQPMHLSDARDLGR